jgi:hypothetical protein
MARALQDCQEGVLKYPPGFGSGAEVWGSGVMQIRLIDDL